jgi:hypothetical protein
MLSCHFLYSNKDNVGVAFGRTCTLRLFYLYRTTREGMRNENPIYGPPAKPPVRDHAKRTNVGGSKGGQSVVGGPYPEIFGPDPTPPIGGKGSNPKPPKPAPEPDQPEEPRTACQSNSEFSAVHVNPVGPGVVASDQPIRN